MKLYEIKHDINTETYDTFVIYAHIMHSKNYYELISIDDLEGFIKGKNTDADRLRFAFLNMNYYVFSDMCEEYHETTVQNTIRVTRNIKEYYKKKVDDGDVSI